MNTRNLTTAAFLAGSLVIAVAAVGVASSPKELPLGDFTAFDSLDTADLVVTGTVTHLSEPRLNTESGELTLEGLDAAAAELLFAELVPLRTVTLEVSELRTLTTAGESLRGSSSIQFSIIGGSKEVTFSPSDAALIGLRVQPDDANASSGVSAPPEQTPRRSFTWRISVSNEVALVEGMELTAYLRLDESARADLSGAELVPTGSTNGFGLFEHRGDVAVHMLTSESLKLADLRERVNALGG